MYEGGSKGHGEGEHGEGGGGHGEGEHGDGGGWQRTPCSFNLSISTILFRFYPILFLKLTRQVMAALKW